jgi:hypothetical protein
MRADKRYRRSEFDPTNAHIRISWSAIAITAIPLILGTLIPSEPLGAGAVNGDISLKAPSLGNVRSITKDKAESKARILPSLAVPRTRTSR